MKQKLIAFLLRNLRGTVAARLKRYILLLILVALAHIPYLEHLCSILALPPDVLAGGIWLVLMDILHNIRDTYPQTSVYLNPIVEGMEETEPPKLSDAADITMKAQPVNPTK